MSKQQTENNNTFMCILSYFGIFALIPYFTQKDNAYINWHARQGLLITAIAIVISFGLGVLSLMPAIGWIASMASMLFSIAVLALCVFCMIQACGGNKWAVPGISSFLEKPEALKSRPSEQIVHQSPFSQALAETTEFDAKNVGV